MQTRFRLLLIFIFCSGQISAQAPFDCDFTANPCLFFSEQPEPIDSAVVTYATNVWSIDEWDNDAGCVIPLFNIPQCENLDLEVFYPQLPAGEKRPLVVLIHGGGFISGNKADFRLQARALAQKGYVAATINYRLCKRNNCTLIANTGCFNLCNANFLLDFGTGMYVAALDAHNAIRYLQEHATQYGIDPENILVGGHSAGAWTAMNLAFLDQDEADGLAAWKNTWGPLHPVSGIRGVLCLAGVAYDTAFIDADERMPVFFVHGTCDPTVGYGHDAPFHCNNSYPKIYGGGDIAQRFQHLGIPYYLFTGVGMGHDISPLQDIWNDQMLRFMRETMLCGVPTQKHVIYQLDPTSAECDLLEFDAPGCDLQVNHAPYPTAPMPASALWTSFPPPCGSQAATYAPNSRRFMQVRPTITTDFFTVEIMGQLGVATVVVLDLQGQELQTFQLQAGNLQQVDISALAAGMYLLHATATNGATQNSFVVKY